MKRSRRAGPWKPSPDELPPTWREVWGIYEIIKRTTISEATLANYLDTLVTFGRFLAGQESRGEAPPLEEIVKEDFAAFISDVKVRTSASTAGMRYRGLSAVFGWLARPGDGEEPFLPSNPVKALRHPKVDEDPVRVLEVDDVLRLLATCRGDGFENRRDGAIIRFMFDTRCRRGEVASMRTDRESLDLREGEALVTGKTGPRPVAFGPTTAAHIQRYLRLRVRHPRAAEPWLWLGRYGPLGGSGVYQALSRRFDDAGIEARKKAHVFRHSFSHHFRMEGGSDIDLMVLNGWTSTAMASRYGKSAAQARAREAHRRYSPGERL
jgi:integrase